MVEAPGHAICARLGVTGQPPQAGLAELVSQPDRVIDVSNEARSITDRQMCERSKDPRRADHRGVVEAGGDLSQLDHLGVALRCDGERQAAAGEHMGERGRIIEAAGHSQGLIGELPAALMLGGETEFVGQVGDQPGPNRRVAPVEGGHRSFEDGDALAVDSQDQAEEPTVIGKRSPGQGVRVAGAVGQGGGVEERLAVRRVAGPQLGLPERDQQVDAAPVPGRDAGGVEEVKGLAVVGGRFVVGELRDGLVAGPGGVIDRPGGIGGRGTGPGPVVGEGRKVLVELAFVDGLERLSHAAVQRDPAGAS